MIRRYKRSLILIGFLTARCWGWVQQSAVWSRRQIELKASAAEDDHMGSIVVPRRFRRLPQPRKKSILRKPRGYWLELSNIDFELREQWKSVNVTIEGQQPPPIPNETLLNYWKRHDLRRAIVQIGGREELAEKLGGAFIIPGKWSEATENIWVKQVLASDPNLDPTLPPLSPQQLRHIGTTMSSSKPIKRKRWIHQSTRKKKGYWTSEVVVVQELYEYLNERRNTRHLPAVWMPLSSELIQAGRNDLRQAIERFGGFKLIGKKAGLIPSREWRYIEGQYDLMLELRAYLDDYCNGDYSTFPNVSKLSEQGYERLDRLIQYYGGKRFVASRLNMQYCIDSSKSQVMDISWGKFDLQFGTDLLEFIRTENMKKNPPLRYPVIAIPSPEKLANSGEKGVLLDEQIRKYGGYENVARRLGLAFFLPRRQRL
eukprot:scaffold683_cov124-Cylindrotheca_fusiformis.AAC.1